MLKALAAAKTDDLDDDEKGKDGPGILAMADARHDWLAGRRSELKDASDQQQYGGDGGDVGGTIKEESVAVRGEAGLQASQAGGPIMHAFGPVTASLFACLVGCGGRALFGRLLSLRRKEC